MIWVLAICALLIQQFVRWLKVCQLEGRLSAKAEELAREADVDVSHTSVVCPWLWPFTGCAYVRVHFKLPGGPS